MSRLPGILPVAEHLDSDDWYTPPYIIEPDNSNVTSARFPSALVVQGRVEAGAVRDSGLGWWVEEW